MGSTVISPYYMASKHDDGSSTYQPVSTMPDSDGSAVHELAGNPVQAIDPSAVHELPGDGGGPNVSRWSQ